MASARTHPLIERFDFAPGHTLARKYEVEAMLGGGWEGEVYLIRETATGIERAAKVFYPHRNAGGRTARVYARKLHHLEDCAIVVRYHALETFRYRRVDVTALVTEFVDGSLLSDFLKGCRGGRLPPFQAVHLLHALARGIDQMHRLGEYHGDLHAGNIIVRRLGLTFDLKVLDLFHRGRASRENRQGDICDIVRLFYDALGGQRHYARQPPQVRHICCGLRRSLILSRFRTAGELCRHVEGIAWG